MIIREEYLKSQLHNQGAIATSGKSDYDLEHESRLKDAQDGRDRLVREERDLFTIPKHLDVDRIKEDRRLIDQTNWISGLIEVPVNQERKIRNVEAAEHLRLQQLKRELQITDDS